MKKIKIPQNIIKELKKVGVSITVNNSDSDEVQIGEVVFTPLISPESFNSLPINKGIILSNSTIELRKSLEAKGINFLDKNGNIFLNTDELNLKLQKIKKKNHKIKQSRGFNKNFSATLLVSPNGFAIIDTIFRLSDLELKEFSSVFSFCKLFSLNQPKLSKIMTTLNVNTLVNLKKSIQKLPIDWWLYSFDNPITKRKMPPFFETAQIYYSNDSKFDSLPAEKILYEIQNKFSQQSCEGPAMVAQNFSELVEDEISLWVSKSEANNFKKNFRLIPGRKEGSKIWRIAIASDLKKMEIKTHILKSNMPSANMMRATWDLSFSESRSREIRENLIRKFLNEL